MCLLIVVRGRFDSHPVLVASNRDERRDRPAAPPGLWVGHRHRLLSPRDRQAGGTWMAVGDQGLFAGLTNVAGAPSPPDATSRGMLPHWALDTDDLDRALEAVRQAVAEHRFAGFQLVLADARRIVVVRHPPSATAASTSHVPADADGLQVVEWAPDVLVVSNEHGPGELLLDGLDAAMAPRPSPEEQLEAMRSLLLDGGRTASGERHVVLKRGDDYGTVSSSLLAVPAGDPTGLIWRFCAGPPDVTEYRNYGNLGRRLLPPAPDADQSLASDRPHRG